MLGIGYVDFRQIPCSCSVCLRKMDSTWNRRKDKHNHVQYTGENKQCVHWPILGSYKNWHIIHSIDSKKQNKSTKSDINVHIKQDDIRNISLKKLTEI